MLTAREDLFFLTREASTTGALSVHNLRRSKKEPIPIREKLHRTDSSKRVHT
jgi:hypothetical protein